MTYRSRRPSQAPLRERLRELAQSRVSYGYLRLHVLLRREGWAINRKRVYRLYTEEGLTLKQRRPARRRSGVVRSVRPALTGPNERWAMDFVHDTLADRTSVRVLAVIDLFRRECVALVAQRQFRGTDVARVLAAAGAARRLPGIIQCDQGTEFTSVTLDHWAYWNQVRLDFSRPGKPGDNTLCEAFNGSLRRECLSQHYFVSLTDAQHALDRWRDEYNNVRPHRSLAYQPPAHFRPGGVFTPGPDRMQKLRA